MRHLDHPFSHFNDVTIARFQVLLGAFVIALEGMRLIVPFYSLQDCRLWAVKWGLGGIRTAERGI